MRNKRVAAKVPGVPADEPDLEHLLDEALAQLEVAGNEKYLLTYTAIRWLSLLAACARLVKYWDEMKTATTRLTST